MADFLNTIGTFFNTSLDWISEIISVVTTSPALTILVFGMPIVGFAVGLLGRLIRL